MTQLYPVFTDGNKFYHMEENSPKGCRFAYFSKLKLKEVGDTYSDVIRRLLCKSKKQ